jgi:hypothetical protein
MTIASFSAGAFEGYAPALRALESSFRKAGLEISFHAHDSPLRGKMVSIRGESCNDIIKIICIEGDSPAQAVKDVARAVNCDRTRKSDLPSRPDIALTFGEVKLSPEGYQSVSDLFATLLRCAERRHPQ